MQEPYIPVCALKQETRLVSAPSHSGGWIPSAAYTAVRIPYGGERAENQDTVNWRTAMRASHCDNLWGKGGMRAITVCICERWVMCILMHRLMMYRTCMALERCVVEIRRRISAKKDLTLWLEGIFKGSTARFMNLSTQQVHQEIKHISHRYIQWCAHSLRD